MKRRKPKTAIVAVTWYDAHDDGSASWVSVDQIDPDPYMVVSVGVLLPDDTKPGHVSVARSVADQYLDHILHIPSGMVKDVTVVACLEDITSQE